MRFFRPRRARMGQRGPAGKCIVSFCTEFGVENTASLIIGTGVAYQFVAGDIGGEVIKTGLGKRTAQVVANSFRCSAAVMAGMRDRAALDELLCGGIRGTGAGNGPG